MVFYEFLIFPGAHWSLYRLLCSVLHASWKRGRCKFNRSNKIHARE